MVPLGVVEDLVAKIWPQATHAVVAVPDMKRGEQLVLVTNHDEPTRAAIVAAAREAGLPEIYVPRSIAKVKSVPLLGSGKVDYVNVGQLASELARAS